jgi:hypothetical protein
MRKIQSVPKYCEEEDDIVYDGYEQIDTYDQQQLIDQLKRTGEIEVRDEEY